MSSSRALCCLPSVKKQKHDLNFFFVQCIIKQLLDSVFVISRIGLSRSCSATFEQLFGFGATFSPSCNFSDFEHFFPF